MNECSYCSKFLTALSLSICLIWGTLVYSMFYFLFSSQRMSTFSYLYGHFYIFFFFLWSNVEASCPFFYLIFYLLIDSLIFFIYSRPKPVESYVCYKYLPFCGLLFHSLCLFVIKSSTLTIIEFNYFFLYV